MSVTPHPAGIRTVLRQFAVAAFLCSLVAVPAAHSALERAGVQPEVLAGGQDNTWPAPSPAPVAPMAENGTDDNTWPSPVTPAG